MEVTRVSVGGLSIKRDESYLSHV